MFFIIFVVYALNTSEDYYIKLYKKEAYMNSRKIDNMIVPYMGIKNTADTFKIKDLKRSSMEKIIVVNGIKEKVLEISGHNKKLVYFVLHGDKNQKFILDQLENLKDTYIIKNNNKCLEYIENKNMIELHKCSSKNNNQKFETIRVKR
jgi:hypothetical protein